MQRFVCFGIGIGICITFGCTFIIDKYKKPMLIFLQRSNKARERNVKANLTVLTVLGGKKIKQSLKEI